MSAIESRSAYSYFKAAVARIGRLLRPLRMRRFPIAAEGAMLAVAIAAFARAAMVIAAPLPAPLTPEPEPASNEEPLRVSLSRVGGHPFRGVDDSRVVSSAPLTESALNVVLYGTWRGDAGSAAMVSADGAPQRKVAAGEEIVSGVTLEDVQDEFIVINNQGAREAVAIKNRKVVINADAAPAVEASHGDALQPSSAPLRDAALDGAVVVEPQAASAEGDADLQDHSADRIAATAPHERD